ERQIRKLRDQFALTVVLVEHNMSVVMSVCETIHVVDHGVTVTEGPPEKIKAHPRVLAAYLGQEFDDPNASRSRPPESDA
ncbi:MAG TPA: high-affinity branched-chain amino acid ABC transporter ATP-binding protein LivG, partial [Polyangiaceae bacterium]